MAEPLIAARGITVAYGGRPVLKNVSLAIAPGETVGIVGESGSGKSTLGRALLRLVPVAAGSIHFEGRDITALDEAGLRPLRRRMQMIFQDPMASLNPRHRLRRILVEPLLLHRLAPDRAAAEVKALELMRRTGLAPNLLDRFPHELSGGQRQRAGIARAAALAPAFVMADEIVSGLDVSTRAQVLNLLRALSDEMGLAMAFISHDLAVVRAMCARVIVMRSGAVVEAGPPPEVFARPRHAYTRSLIDAIPPHLPDADWLG